MIKYLINIIYKNNGVQTKTIFLRKCGILLTIGKNLGSGKGED